MSSQALDHDDVGSNLPAVPEVTLGSHSNSSLTIQSYKIRTRPWPEQSELTLKIHYTQIDAVWVLK